MSSREILECVTLDRLGGNANVYSYIILKGRRVMKAKWKSRSEGSNEEDYVKLKAELLRNITQASPRAFQHLLNEIGRLVDEVKEALKTNGYRVKECVIRSTTRFIGGVGEAVGQVPFEVGLFLDPILGIPYIPGSTLKGAFRHAFVDLTGNEALAEELFGTTGARGLVGVADAYPVEINGRLLEPDVVTPHYPGASTELDVQPNPVTFLTVAPGVKFKFYIYYKDKAADYIMQGDLAETVKTEEELLKLLRDIDRTVLYALARGVGAKTSVGYSRFDVISYKDA